MGLGGCSDGKEGSMYLGGDINGWNNGQAARK